MRTAGGRRIRFPAHVSDASPEGAGLTLLAPLGTALSRGEQLYLLVPLDGGVELPAHVMRFASASDRTGLYELGLRLRPEIAPAAHRRAYQRWVASLIAALEDDDGPDIEITRTDYDPTAPLAPEEHSSAPG